MCSRSVVRERGREGEREREIVDCAGYRYI